MTIAVITEADADYGIRTLSCPATQLVAGRGAFTLWPKSEHPITVPFAWCYDLHFKELAP